MGQIESMSLGRGRTARKRFGVRPAIAFAGALVLMLGVTTAAYALTPPPPAAGAGKIPDVKVPGVSAQDFENSDVCGECHVDIYKEWQGSMHRNYENPAFIWANAQADKDTKGKTKGFCVACHTPIGAITGETEKVRGTGLSALARKGVQCDFCHVIDKVNPDWPGNASFHVAPGNIKRGQLKDAVSPKHKTAYSELHTKAEFCGMCHNLSHPLSGVPLEQTYTEWKNSDYAKEGKVCQDCHMPPKKGRAAKQGPVRPKRYTHSFVGGNYRFANEKLAVENLKKAAQLEMKLSGTEMTPGSQLRVSVKVKNVGAGHYLPTGITELRQMWLEVVAKDSGGNEVYRGKREYGTILEDANGKHDRTVPIWNAVKIYEDRRVPPKDSVNEDFQFALETSARGSVTVEAALWYRSLPEDFTKAAGVEPAEPVQMTSASDKVEMRPTWGSVIFGGALGGIVWLPEVLLVIVVALLALVLFAAWRARRKKKSAA